MNKQPNKRNETISNKSTYSRNQTGNKNNKNTPARRISTNQNQNVKAKTTTQKPQAQSRTSNAKATRPIEKTPAQIAREREIREYREKVRKQREYELKKQQAKRAYERKKRLNKIKSSLGVFFKNVLIGIVLAVFVFIIIGIIYYRSATKITNNDNNYRIEFYDYIDESSTDDNTAELIEARKNGTEKPYIVLKDALIISDKTTYLPLSSIADYFNFTVSGDSKSRTLIIGNSQSEYTGTNSVVFTFDSNEIKINGASHTLEDSAFLKSSELYIPLEFIKRYIKGIEIDIETKNNTDFIKITKTLPTIYFSASENSPLETPDISNFVPSSQSRYQYSIDLSDYQQYINPKNPDAYLFLVNNQNKLSADYVPSDLTDVIYTRNDRETQKMRLDAAKSLEAFLKAAYASGHSDITVTSAYRSYAYQSSLFNTRLEQNKKTYGAEMAEAKTAEFTAYPGSSEHQSGLCCDMHNLPSAMQSFANTEAYKWLYEHCADFGFILRYPKSKEDVTGIKYEPWHFRFVGRYHAQKIMDSGLSLEEYVANLDNN